MAGRTYRLPTESEWEFAARAGSGKRFFFGDDIAGLEQFAWLNENSRKQVQAVGLKLPNSWGLYDVYGNAAEWCSDWLAEYPTAGATDPRGPESGNVRVIRGGGCWEYSRVVHSGLRQFGNSESLRGFRVLCEVSPSIAEKQPAAPGREKSLEGPIADVPNLSKSGRYRMENKFDR
jgi:formylglycine-generating enzyme required for sulfatase activity